MSQNIVETGIQSTEPIKWTCHEDFQRDLNVIPVKRLKNGEYN